MKDFKNDLSVRLRNATQAKQAMRLRAERPGADDPAVIERKAAREAIVTAREARLEAKARADSERAAREASEQAEQAALKKRQAREMADREVAMAAEQKTVRDARYAARKKRKV